MRPFDFAPEPIRPEGSHSGCKQPGGGPAGTSS